ncbi:MAG: (2Fe-2S)-binding protein [Lentisphaerae bacterium RIFOXYB12_FULL_65_16]|nr:MAG: (2Fe-2S)-binding protein [Lentisphaerae bacterium RIFOXYA12_64_32]OGV88341.1 MAG: (2Fe-2S)-binding protein [Lentisphaerae bacterium RIFOXYB12_FULL_65_16]
MEWQDVGAAEELARQPVQEIEVGHTTIALVCRDGQFSAISGKCNHVGGPLGHGHLEGEHVVCPWHSWRFDGATGEGKTGCACEGDKVPTYAVKVENGRVLVSAAEATPRVHKPRTPHPLTKIALRGQPGGPAVTDPLRVVGISTTNMDVSNPRYSTSDRLLNEALGRARDCGAETRLVRLAELQFRACEGYYSKSSRACIWPCSITQMDPADQMQVVYDAFVRWGDIVIVATPIRWGQASSLYYKMVERMNCIQNQETIANRHLMRTKVVGLIITGGQDNIQAVAGQMLTFFGELGCQFPQYPFIAHSRGWSAEDMENNVRYVEESKDLHEAAAGLVDRCLDTCRALLGVSIGAGHVPRGGRKAHELDVHAQI